MQSLLHGSPVAKEEGDVQVIQHSKLVARGKYIHGIESKLNITPGIANTLIARPIPAHKVKPSAVDEYKRAAYVFDLYISAFRYQILVIQRKLLCNGERRP